MSNDSKPLWKRSNCLVHFWPVPGLGWRRFFSGVQTTQKICQILAHSSTSFNDSQCNPLESTESTLKFSSADFLYATWAMNNSPIPSHMISGWPKLAFFRGKKETKKKQQEAMLTKQKQKTNRNLLISVFFILYFLWCVFSFFVLFSCSFRLCVCFQSNAACRVIIWIIHNFYQLWNQLLFHSPPFPAPCLDHSHCLQQATHRSSSSGVDGAHAHRKATRQQPDLKLTKLKI